MLSSIVNLNLGYPFLETFSRCCLANIPTIMLGGVPSTNIQSGAPRLWNANSVRSPFYWIWRKTIIVVVKPKEVIVKGSRRQKVMILYRSRYSNHILQDQDVESLHDDHYIQSHD